MTIVRRVALVVMALTLPACGIWQCAAGNDIQQTVTVDPLSRLAVVLIGLTLLLLVLALIAGPRWGDR